ncbi:hypothetical protein [Halobellus rufus]|uniref:hypothetical protein n=1 Tax=Halobellus rufus TaxID=1448860 RepID=UPI000678D638|nr:hypothetical protein [Halobellus rufus]
MSGGDTTYGERLWIEQATDWIAARVAQTLPAIDPSAPAIDRFQRIPRPYLLIGSLILLDVFLLHSIQQLTVGRNLVFDNPSWLALPATVLLAVFTNRYARDRYARACREIRIESRVASDSTSFQRLVPRRPKRLLFVAAVVGYYAYLLATGRIPTIVEYEGLAGLFGWLVVIPFGYAPVLVETAAIYASLHFSLPRRFDAEEVKFYYFDPHNLGGLRPIGELLKHSFYLFVAGVVLLTVLLYAPFVFPGHLYTPYQPPERVVSALLTGLWALGVFSIGFSLLTLHRYMRKRRRRKLKSLEQRFYDVVGDPYEVQNALTDPDELERFERERHRIGQVRDTKEFPASTAMWLQVIVGGVIPLVIQWGVRWLANTV